MAALGIVTFNLLHGLSLRDGQARVADLRAAAGMLDADVLALQEVDRHQPRSAEADQTAVVAAELSAPWWRFVPTLHGTPEPGKSWVPADEDDGSAAAAGTVRGPAYGIGLVSRQPVLQWRVLRFARAAGSLPLLVPGRGIVRVPDEPRVAVAAIVAGPSGPFTIATTHVSFVPPHGQRQLRAIVRWLAGAPRPVLLAGDLNTPGRLPAWLSGYTQLARRATYPSWKPRVQWDHVLADGVAPAQVGEVSARQLPVSDHCALRVDVDL